MISLGHLHYSEWAELMCSTFLSIHIAFELSVPNSAVDEWSGSVTVHNRSIRALFCRKKNESLRQVFFFPESESDFGLIDTIRAEHVRIWGNA